LADSEADLYFRTELHECLWNRLDRVKLELRQAGWAGALGGPLHKTLAGRDVTLDDRPICIGGDRSIVGVAYAVSEAVEGSWERAETVLEIVDEMDRSAADEVVEIERRLRAELTARHGPSPDSLADESDPKKDVEDEAPSP